MSATNIRISRFLDFLRLNNHARMQVSGRLKVMRYYLQWQRMKQSKMSAIQEELPWINFEAIEYLSSILNPTMKVFEYGTGGSSVFFSKRVKEVVGVEHDELWYKRVTDAISQKSISNFKGIFAPPTKLDIADKNADYSSPYMFFSSDERYLNRFSFHDYVTSIDRFADEYFDIVSVDGRARPACILHAIPKIRKGGFLILDNSDRKYYTEKLVSELSVFTIVFDKFGPGPFNHHFWGTTFYKKD